MNPNYKTKKRSLQELEKRLRDSNIGKTCNYIAAVSASNRLEPSKPTLSREERARRSKLKKISKQSKRRNRG